MAAGVALSLHEASRIRTAEAHLLKQNFDKDVNDALALVRAQMTSQEQLLRAGVALYNASDEVSASEWRTFTQQMRLHAQYPGLRSLGFAGRIRTGPAVPLPEPLAAAYIEPADVALPQGVRNRILLRLDMAGLPVLRTAMALARDTGEAALSGKLELAATPGLPAEVQSVMYLPVYNDADNGAAVAGRRAALRGYVFGFLRMDELVEAALAGQVDAMSVELFDGRLPVPEARIYSARTAPGNAQTAALERVLQFDMGQRGWTLRFEALPAYAAATPAGRSASVLTAGLLLTLLFTAALGVLMRQRFRAEWRAASMGRAYRSSEARAQSVVAHTAEGILTTDAEGRVLSANPAIEAIFGWTLASLVGRPLDRLLDLPLDELRSVAVADTWRRDLAALTQDGREVLVRVAVSVMQVDGQRGHVVVVSDMTQQKLAEQAAAQIAQLNTAILQSAPFMVVSSDKDGVIQSVNAATERMLRFRRDELVGRSVFETLLLQDELEAHAAQASIDLGVDVPALAIGARALRGLADEGEWNLLRKDGSTLPVNLALAAIRDARGQPTGFVGIAYDISERKRTESYIRHLAHHDALTGLPNRVLLQDRVEMAIEHAKRYGRHVAVLLLDLDHFKDINDSLGHGTGDLVLQQAATRLCATVRHSDTVARMGGDEFCVVLGDLDSHAEAAGVAQKILEAVRPSMQVGAHALHITASIGVAVYPEDGVDLTTLLQNADTAMYVSKKRGRDAFESFAPATLPGATP